MAEEKTISTEQPMAEEDKTIAAEQTEQSEHQKMTRDYYVGAHNEQLADDFAAAHTRGKAIYQCEDDDIRRYHAIQEVYADKDGNIKTGSIPAPESLHLLQIMKDRGIGDPRIISFKNREAFGLHIAKNAKAVEVLKFDRENKPYTKKFFFVADTYSKEEEKTLGKRLKLSPIEVNNHRGDVYLRNMVRFLKMRNDRGNLKPEYYQTMVSNAKESAHKSYMEMKPLYEEEDKRRAIIDKTPIDAPIEKEDYVSQFVLMYKLNVAKHGAMDADFQTMQEALVEKKWPEKIARGAFTMVSPNVAFDSLREKRGTPVLANKILAAVKKGKAYAEMKEKEKTAAAAH